MKHVPASDAPSGRMWNHGDFRRLWFSTAISELGTQVSELAIPLTAISLLHASALQVGALAAAGYAPMAVIGLVAGAWVDRLRRRSVLLATDLARGAVLVSIPVASTLWHVTVLQLVVVAVLVGALSVFFDVAYPTYLPEILTGPELARGNSRLEVGEQGAAVLGPGLAGLLIGLVGAPLAVAADAASYFGSAAFVGRIRHREARRPGASSPAVRMRTQISDGFRYVISRRPLLAIALAAGLANLFGRMVVVVALLYLVRVVGYSAFAIGAVFAVGSIGFLIGAATADRVIAAIGLGRAIVAGGCVAGSAFLLLAVPPASEAGPFVTTGMFVYGIGALTFTVGNATLRQLIVPKEILGRVTASMRFLVWLAQPFAGLLGGIVATRVGLHAALWVGAIGATTATIPLIASGLWSLQGGPPSG